MDPEYDNPQDAQIRSLLKALAWGLLILLVFGLSMTVWQSRSAEKTTATTVPQKAQVRSAAASGVDKLGMWAREFSSASTRKQTDMERYRAALQNAIGLEGTADQSSALGHFMDGMSPEIAAILLAGLNPTELKSDAAQRLFDHWATANPREAIDWAQGQGDPQLHMPFMTLAAMRWAVTDLGKATAWATSLPEGDARTEIMTAVGSEAVRTDPLAALILGLELPKSPAQTELILRSVAEWAITDRENALAWLSHIKDNGLRQQVTEQIVVASAEADPIGAVTLAVQQMDPGESRDRALVAVVQRWVQTDAELASAWVSQLPANTLGRDAINTLVNLWASRDLDASGDWLLALPPGELQNVGIKAYSRVLDHRGENQPKD